jgi:dolichol-phosphate mannosyltransferase
MATHTQSPTPEPAASVLPPTAVMLPTYNEVENLEKVVEALLAQPLPVQVMVVDDLSPDGTGALADSLAARHPGRVHAVHRTGARGRGRAGAEGLRRCLALPVEAVVEMDADLSHDPDDLPRLVAALARADVAVGSRYVAGGGETNRPLLRRAISRLANAYLRIVLGVPLRDCSSGYRAFRREILERAHLETLTAPGPQILSEVLWRLRCLHARMVEVPIHFRDREAGVSKLNWRILLLSLWWPLKQRLRGQRVSLSAPAPLAG